MPSAGFSDPALGTLDADDFSIEFNIGEDEDEHSITYYVRGISGGTGHVLSQS